MPPANDVAFGNDDASLMMCPAGHKGKHRIIVSGANNIISELCCETSFADKGGDIIGFLPLMRYLLMKENKLADLSLSFSVQIINLIKDLKSKHESVIPNQIGRSGTSIMSGHIKP